MEFSLNICLHWCIEILRRALRSPQFLFGISVTSHENQQQALYNEEEIELF